MIFKTHELPEKYKITKSANVIWTIGALLLAMASIILAIESHNFILPFCFILFPFLLLSLIFAIIIHDMKKAYVEIIDNKIIAVDYYLGIKREKIFFTEEVVSAEMVSGYSVRIRGYRFSGKGFHDLKYMVFRKDKNRYMFKLICSEETRKYFENYFEIKNSF